MDRGLESSRAEAVSAFIFLLKLFESCDFVSSAMTESEPQARLIGTNMG
jgi:hypothetical protein